MSGITNYNVNKPSHAFTDKTTEFDDILIERGVITKEQAIVAKGATAEEARRIVAESSLSAQAQHKHNNGNNCVEKKIRTRINAEPSASDESESDDDDDSWDDGEYDSILSQYREMRLAELRTTEAANNKKSVPSYGDVIPISRPDWEREVNHASENGQWVVIHLAASGGGSDKPTECAMVEQSVNTLAKKFPHIKFVSIPSKSAIENWPDANLPTMFLYRDGTMKHQMIGIDAFGGRGVNTGRMEWRLANYGVIDTELVEDPPRSDFDAPSASSRVIGGGGMAEMGTYDQGNDEDDFHEEI